MRDYLNYINDRHPIRRDNSEKKAFRKFVEEEVCSSAYKCEPKIEPQTKRMAFGRQVETDNIIIGDINSAEVIFTAHYDTPVSSIISNMILPKNPVLRVICHWWLIVVIALLAFIIGCFLSALITTEPFLQFFLWLTIYLGLFALTFCFLTRFFKNKHNTNDNTSGVATVLSLVKKCTSQKIAFVLFDNEERGLLGSKMFLEKNTELLKDKLIINFDCVGVGNNVFFIVKEGAQNHKLYNKFEVHNHSNDGFNVLFGSYDSDNKITSSSDHKTFECSIGVVTCKKKWGIYYSGKIHTNRDTEANTENIDFLVDNMIRFVDDLS